MSYWEGTTKLATAEIAECAKNMLENGMNRAQRLFFRGTTWGPIDDGAGGVFAGFDERPTWSARATLVRKRTAAYCDVRVFDHGDLRSVRLDLGKSFGGGSDAKKLAQALIMSLRTVDPGLSSSGGEEVVPVEGLGWTQ